MAATQGLPARRPASASRVKAQQYKITPHQPTASLMKIMPRLDVAHAICGLPLSGPLPVICSQCPNPRLMTPSLLILTDFFRAANGALDYATHLAGPLGARLVLLHVRRDSVLDPEMFTGELSDLSQEATALALSRVADDADRAGDG